MQNNPMIDKYLDTLMELHEEYLHFLRQTQGTTYNGNAYYTNKTINQQANTTAMLEAAKGVTHVYYILNTEEGTYLGAVAIDNTTKIKEVTLNIEATLNLKGELTNNLKDPTDLFIFNVLRKLEQGKEFEQYELNMGHVCLVGNIAIRLNNNADTKAVYTNKEGPNRLPVIVQVDNTTGTRFTLVHLDKPNQEIMVEQVLLTYENQTYKGQHGFRDIMHRREFTYVNAPVNYIRLIKRHKLEEE